MLTGGSLTASMYSKGVMKSGKRMRLLGVVSSALTGAGLRLSQDWRVLGKTTSSEGKRAALLSPCTNPSIGGKPWTWMSSEGKRAALLSLRTEPPIGEPWPWLLLSVPSIESIGEPRLSLWPGVLLSTLG